MPAPSITQTNPTTPNSEITTLVTNIPQTKDKTNVLTTIRINQQIQSRQIYQMKPITAQRNVQKIQTYELRYMTNTDQLCPKQMAPQYNTMERIYTAHIIHTVLKNPHKTQLHLAYAAKLKTA